MGRRHLRRPPIEDLIAVKPIRAEPKDLNDIRFLLSRHRPGQERVRRIVAGFPIQARERATENLVCLEIMEK